MRIDGCSEKTPGPGPGRKPLSVFGHGCHKAAPLLFLLVTALILALLSVRPPDPPRTTPDSTAHALIADACLSHQSCWTDLLLVSTLGIPHGPVWTHILSAWQYLGLSQFALAMAVALFCALLLGAMAVLAARYLGVAWAVAAAVAAVTLFPGPYRLDELWNPTLIPNLSIMLLLLGWRWAAATEGKILWPLLYGAVTALAVATHLIFLLFSPVPMVLALGRSQSSSRRFVELLMVTAGQVATLTLVTPTMFLAPTILESLAGGATLALLVGPVMLGGVVAYSDAVSGLIGRLLQWLETNVGRVLGIESVPRCQLGHLVAVLLLWSGLGAVLALMASGGGYYWHVATPGGALLAALAGRMVAISVFKRRAWGTVMAVAAALLCLALGARATKQTPQEPLAKGQVADLVRSFVDNHSGGPDDLLRSVALGPNTLDTWFKALAIWPPDSADRGGKPALQPRVLIGDELLDATWLSDPAETALCAATTSGDTCRCAPAKRPPCRLSAIRPTASALACIYSSSDAAQALSSLLQENPDADLFVVGNRLLSPGQGSGSGHQRQHYAGAARTGHSGGSLVVPPVATLSGSYCQGATMDKAAPIVWYPQRTGGCSGLGEILASALFPMPVEVDFPQKLEQAWGVVSPQEESPGSLPASCHAQLKELLDQPMDKAVSNGAEDVMALDDFAGERYSKVMVRKPVWLISLAATLLLLLAGTVVVVLVPFRVWRQQRGPQPGRRCPLS